MIFSVGSVDMAVPRSLRYIGRRHADGEVSRRIMDLVTTLVGLAVLAPLFLLCVFAIYLESGSPLLYSQVRLGERGRHFRLYKFRKFRQDSAATGPSVTVENDPRLTRVGRLLAVTKLDELPQLWNVVKGDMSIVGPRPESSGVCGLLWRGLQRYFGVSAWDFWTEPGVLPKRRFFIPDGWRS